MIYLYKYRDLILDNANVYLKRLAHSVFVLKKNSKFIYRIYQCKCTLPINPPLLCKFANFIFWGFTSLSTANTFAIPGLRKKMRFSTSPIKYRL